MRTRCSKRFGVRQIALLGLLQLIPILAIAALASRDLTGAARAIPNPTVGALEASVPLIGIAVPIGLTVAVERVGH